MGKFTLTINGNETTLDFGDAIIADASGMGEILPDSVTHLEVRGNKVTYIGDNFLRGCSLTSVDLTPLKDVIHVGDNFLYWCKNLTSMDLSSFNNVTRIGNNFLRSCPFTSLDLSPFNKVTEIGNGFLSWCTNLQEIDLTPLRNVIHIGDEFLYGCKNLTSVDLTPLEKNFPDIRKRFPYLPHKPTLKENKIIDKEKLNSELFIACKRGLVNAASMLIEAGADVNYIAQAIVGIGEEKKWTCLHEAVAMSQSEIVQLLLKHGALMGNDENDRTPLDIAFFTQNKDIIRLLVKHGA